VLIPGTGVIYTISTGIFLGFRGSVFAAVGCTFGIIPHLTASVLGLSVILHMSAVMFNCIKYAGALYLLYLAYMMWRDTRALSFNSQPTKNGSIHIATRGFLINILNPKLTIFFLAFLPLFVSPDSKAPVYDMFGLSLVFMLMTLIVFIIYGFLANSVRRHVVSSPKLVQWMQKSFAATFAALGLKLAFTDR
jgi:threonine/homoserine/homoserine lactone efflux protein